MAIDFVRGNNGRCPSFVVGGLLVMCLFLVCSWWSLSSQNLELLRQIDDLAEQLKINGVELDKCTQQRTALDEHAKNLQNGAAQQSRWLEQMKASEVALKSKLLKEESENGQANKKVESAVSALEICTVELESVKKLGQSKDKTLESLRTEKTAFLKNLEEKEKKMKDLEERISLLKKGGEERSKTNIVQMMRGKMKLSDKVNEGVALGGSHDAAAAQDENNAAEVKADNDPVAPVPENDGDPREEAMAAH